MNSKEWWNTVKNDHVKFNSWLQKQYFGETKAAERIKQLITKYNLNKEQSKIIKKIAKQEENHAKWIFGLLKSRGVQPLEKHKERYWKETGIEFDTSDEAFAVAAHAEKMRLERIQVIVDDVNAPSDVRKIFKLILKDELFHEKAFKELSTPEQYKKSEKNHKAGLKSLGLTL